MMLPVTAGTKLALSVVAEVAAAAELRVELRQSSRPDNHTPDVTLEKRTIALTPGAGQDVPIAFEHAFADERYAFVCFFGRDAIRLRASEQRLTGVLALCHQVNLAVAKSAVPISAAPVAVQPIWPFKAPVT